MSSRVDKPIDVLLVEDDDGDVRLLREAFDQLDIETRIRVASDGEQAVTLLTDRGDEQRAVPDLVLLDLDLPRMNGLELLETLAAEPELARLPVLVLTKSTSVADVHASYELAANAYLTKPTTTEGYVKMVNAVAEFWFRRAALPSIAS
ncbi:response regulator [Natrinema zhouii]|uniref:Response regulator n=1 Tax=Natrinema zhouii TaxID=1710539 RepID=A0A7D6GQP6_9EURY|nr:response regulator [Natrinema zhouii]QLK25283.1 response regulator [Natrinema zhouii]